METSIIQSESDARDAEFNDRSQRSGVDVDVLLRIDETCGLLSGALANVLCQHGHELSTHPTL